MRILRSVAAIVIGLGFMAATARVGTLLAAAVLGAPQSSGGSPAYLLINLLTGGVGAVLGGWLCARIASFAPYGHAALMAAIVGMLSITIATGPAAPGQPGWYPSAMVLVAILGVLLGGKLRAAAAAASGRVIA